MRQTALNRKRGGLGLKNEVTVDVKAGWSFLNYTYITPTRSVAAVSLWQSLILSLFV